METLKYKLIKTREQYNEYCKTLEKLTDNGVLTNEIEDEIEVLTFFIESWDKDHEVFKELGPIPVLKYLMKEHKLHPKDLAKIINVHTEVITDLLNYKRGFSKEIIIALSSHFKLNHKAFNRPYKLKIQTNPRLRTASLMNTIKDIDLVH